MKTRYSAVAAAVAALLPFAQPTFGQEATIGGEPQVSGELDEIFVTARRREEVVQDVPLPISVLDASALERSGNFNVIRLQQLTPSLQVYSSNPRNSAANIRGLGAPFGLTNDGIEQGVGQYVDDVYYSRAASSTLDFIDVERIEVLRGPQGTLYGKNTTAGAINITTRAPSFDFESRAELSAGNYGFYQAKASLSGPLVDDKLAARVAVSTLNRHGTIYNIATATKIGELDSIGVRGQLLWKAGENTDVTFAADWNQQDPECCAQISARYGQTQRGANRQYWGLAYIQDTDPYTAGVQRYVAPGSVPGGPGNALSGTFAPFDRVTDVDAPLNAGSELGGASVRAVWDLGAGEFTSVTAFRYWNWLPQNDRDFTGLPITTKSENPSKQDQYTQEFRYAWAGERIDYVVGLFGYKQEVHTDGVQEQGPAASRWLLHPSNAPQNVLNPAPEVLNLLTAYNDIDFENVSAALFGQLTWRITDRFRLEPGLRLNYDDKKGSYVSRVVNGQGETLPINPADAFYTSTTPFLLSTGVNSTYGVVRTAQRSILPPQTYNAQFDDWNVSGSLTSAFEFTQDVLGYATYSRGFKTGGITLNGAPTQANGEPIVDGTTVDPEEVNHYELGLKTQFLNRTLTVNLAAFLTDIKDFQATVNNNLGTSTIRGYLANAEKARVDGLEVDVSWSPNQNWSFYANGALTGHEWVSFTDAPCPPELSGNSVLLAPGAVPQPGVAGAPSPANCDISGQWLPGISKLAGSWGIEYQRPASLLKQQGEVYFAYDGSARSKFSSNASRSIYTDVSGYALTNFRVGFRSGDNWELNGWVRNAFNKDYYEQLAAGTGGNTGLIAANLGDPRVYGVTVRVDF